MQGPVCPPMSEASEQDLRLRYLDWCSVQIVRRFFELSPDEVWQRANQADAQPLASGDPLLPEAPASARGAAPPGFLSLVRKTTLILAQELRLPSFEAWRSAYLADPRPFQQDLLEMGDSGSDSRR